MRLLIHQYEVASALRLTSGTCGSCNYDGFKTHDLVVKICSRVGGDAVVIKKIEEGGGPGSDLDGGSEPAVLGEGVLVVPSLKEKSMYAVINQRVTSSKP